MNTHQFKQLWKSFERAKGFQKTISSDLSTKLLDIDMIILLFVGSHNRIALTRILKHKYFNQYGSSTIKRSVSRLITLGLIEQGQWQLDERKKLLSVNFDLIGEL